MAYKAFVEGKIYRTRKGTYKGVRIEDVKPGDVIDFGVFAGIDPRGKGQGPNTVNVRLADGMHYTESKNAVVRVWI
jgi:hypothetical protein